MTLTADSRVVVVGAGLGGWRLAEALRREGFAGVITLVGDEPDPPYDRPPLSKQVLRGDRALDHVDLATPAKVAEVGVELRLGRRAVGLDVDARAATLEGGDRVAGDVLVVATGARARTLDFPGAGVPLTLRSRADAERLVAAAERLEPGSPVVVIGGGFVGAEVATSLHARGLAPVVLEALDHPLVSVLGPTVAEWLAPAPERAGVELRAGVGVDDVAGGPGDFRVALADGSELAAPLAVLAVGALPNVEWLEGTGVRLERGVVVDARLEAAPGVHALGDVARFPYPGPEGDELVRVEHWQNAADHAVHLARVLAVGDTLAPVTPYFWSDQYGVKIQLLGHPHPDDEVT
ncbi:MAG TPA: FAD/NAD(P)-binding oxidoreductase, partial [Acidimicrobiales bacterium]|nr:FAD/NAD(P)-binding oxidoreductase [Acidimicrobiales bacterium]